MKKIFIYLILLTILLTGCKKEVKTPKDSNRDLAIIEAKSYIRQKYIIELNDNNITNVNVEKNYEYSGISPTGYAEITANYNGKEFKISLNYYNKNMNNYYDDYERDIILDAINEYYYSKLNISKENSITYIPETIIYSPNTNQKFTTLEDLFSRLNNDYKSIYIVTTDEIINPENIISDNQENITIYKLDKNEDFTKYNKNNFIKQNSNGNTISFNKLTNYSNLYVKEEYYCLSTCIKTTYKTTALDNDFYIKNTIPDKHNNQYDINIKKINTNEEITNKINECGNNLNILSVYELTANKTKFTNEEMQLTMYNYYHNNQNQNISFHIIDNTISCNTIDSSNSSIDSLNTHILKNLKNYLVITEKK